jgi:hypothetical protein
MDQPQYVTRWRTIGSMQPFDISGATMHGFFFRGDRAALQATCDAQLNAPSGTRYEVLLPIVLLTFAELDKVVARQPPYCAFGTNREAELTIWVAVHPAGSLDPAEMRLFTPYMLVNNPLAVQHGREIFGFPKEYAQFPRWGKDGFDVDAYAFTTWAADTIGRMQTVMSVVPDAPHGLAKIIDTLLHPLARVVEDLLTAVEAELHLGAEALRPVLRLLTPPQGIMLGLKQLPDIANSGVAVHQSLVEAPLGVPLDAFDELVPVLAPYRLAIPGHASHPFMTDLGLSERSLAGFRARFSFSLEAGRTLVPTHG